MSSKDIDTKIEEEEELQQTALERVKDSVKPKIMISKQVHIKTNEEYLEIYGYLKKILDGKSEEEANKLRNGLAYRGIDKEAIELVRYISNGRLSIGEEFDYTGVSPLVYKGESLNSEEVSKLLHFYDLMKAREEGKEWGELLTTIVYSDDTASNDNFIRVLEIETGESIEGVDDIIKALGGKQVYDMSREEEREEHLDTFHRAMEHRLHTRIEKMLDSGALWEELINIDLSKYNLKDGKLKTFDYKEQGGKSYEHFLLMVIGFYYSYTDYELIPLKPSYLVRILEAPREIEFKLKALWEDKISFHGSHGELEYIAKEDGMVRAMKRATGEDVFADNLNRKKVREKLRNEANRD